MSYVVPLKTGVFSGLMIHVLEYASNFWFWLDGEPRLQTPALFSYRDFGDYGPYYQAKWSLFFRWAEGDDVFNQSWTFWKFPRGSRAQLAEDWVPLEQYMLDNLAYLPVLPQEPQKRQRVRMPDGSTRSIRIK